MKPFLKSNRVFLFLAAAIFAGIIFRFLWPLDIEMKFDETETFNYLRDWRRGEISFPWVGQPSSNGLRHPGLGIWLFLLLGKVFPVETFVDLARIPPVLAVLNLALLLGFSWFALRGLARRYFLWTVALMAVNPFLVLMDRKLWHPSVMGLFVSVFFLAWMKRRSRWGSFFLGLFCLLPGQVHMSGFFVTLGFFLCDLLYNRFRTLRSVLWPAFGGGLLLSILPLAPWIYWLVADLGKGDSVSSKFSRLFGFKYPNYWFSNAFGVLGTYPFGTVPYRQPLYSGLAIILLLLAVAGGLMFFFRAWRFVRRRQRAELTQLELFASFGTGLIATLSLMHIPRYFTLCLGFVPFLSAVRSLSLFRYGKILLASLIVVQAAVSLFLLAHIHYQPYPQDKDFSAYGVFGIPVRECGNCDGVLKFERISGGEETVDTGKRKEAGQ
ncbi:MAG: hypothetical protein AB7K68_04445 [Bacteriovoracia bacterium]